MRNKMFCKSLVFNLCNDRGMIVDSRAYSCTILGPVNDKNSQS